LSLVTTTTTRASSHGRTASRRLTVPSTLTANVSTGSTYDARTIACAARWITTSGRCRASARARPSASRMSSNVLSTPSERPADSNRLGRDDGGSA
jgi:hypothetical protein